jgi:hypothetical protein
MLNTDWKARREGTAAFAPLISQQLADAIGAILSRYRFCRMLGGTYGQVNSQGGYYDPRGFCYTCLTRWLGRIDRMCFEIENSGVLRDVPARAGTTLGSWVSPFEVLNYSPRESWVRAQIALNSL